MGQYYVSKGLGFEIYACKATRKGFENLLEYFPKLRERIEKESGISIKEMDNYDTFDEFRDELQMADFGINWVVAACLDEVFGHNGWFYADMDDDGRYTILDLPLSPSAINPEMLKIKDKELEEAFNGVLRVLYDDPNYEEEISMINCVNWG